MLSVKKILNNFPLRIAITNFCNIKCFFCSNEGMPLSQKNNKNIDFVHLKYLIKVLAEKGLKNISLTGGDPTLYPQLSELLIYLTKFNFKDVFFHTNGINLNQKSIEEISKACSKIAISIPSCNYEVWQKITRGRKKQFECLMNNLKKISKVKKSLIEIKFVPIKGFNDTKNEIKKFLELCNKYGFKFKFLNFEPIDLKQINLAIPIKQIENKLIKAGCTPLKKEIKFRGQKDYLPIVPLMYKNCRGVLIEIGCGLPNACWNCYKSNEIFITPDLKIKPCHINSLSIPLVNLIRKKNKEGIYKAIKYSRSFLQSAPGIGKKIWGVK
ncbi:MAG: radical SAM protein [Promethearchaeota archaeon]